MLSTGIQNVIYLLLIYMEMIQEKVEAYGRSSNPAQPADASSAKLTITVYSG